MALLDSLGPQRGEASTEEGAPDSLPTAVFCCDQVMNEAAPSIVTAEDCSDEILAFTGDETDPIVSRKETCDGFWFIGIAQADTGRALSQSPRSGVVIRFERKNDAQHRCDCDA